MAAGPVARVHTARITRGGFFWAQGSVNYVRTGSLDRIGLAVGVGVSWLASSTIAIGPRVDYREIFAMSGAPYSTSNAGVFTFGLAVEFGLFDPKSVVSRDTPSLSTAGTADPDPDHDGVLGSADQCPFVPEDRDGFQDDDGCPDLDDDGDGVSDANDACPRERGLASSRGCPDQDGDEVPDRFDRCPAVPGLVSENGCPRYPLITVTEQKIDTDQKILFAPSRATLLPRSFEVLENVMRVLRDRAPLCLRIEGHGDAVQSPKLALSRAEAVRAFLISRGVHAVSLSAVGLHESGGATRIELMIVPCLLPEKPQ